jgi:hypothetical protein
MVPRAHLAVALTLAALGLAPGAAHLMELPVKLNYSPVLYAEVTSTLYVWYGIAGGAVQVAAALTVAILAVRVRRSHSAGLVFASAASLVISLLLWGALVAPVNSTWAEFNRANPGEFTAAYARLRARWEFGHLAAFIAWVTGWLGLVAAATRQPAARAKGVL